MKYYEKAAEVRGLSHGVAFAMFVLQRNGFFFFFFFFSF